MGELKLKLVEGNERTDFETGKTGMGELKPKLGEREWQEKNMRQWFCLPEKEDE